MRSAASDHRAPFFFLNKKCDRSELASLRWILHVKQGVLAKLLKTVAIFFNYHISRRLSTAGQASPMDLKLSRLEEASIHRHLV